MLTHAYTPVIKVKITKLKTPTGSFHHLLHQGSHDPTQSLSDLPSMSNTVSFVFGCSVSLPLSLLLLTACLNVWTPALKNRPSFCVKPLLLLSIAYRGTLSHDLKSPRDLWGMTWLTVYTGHDGWLIQAAAMLLPHSHTQCKYDSGGPAKLSSSISIAGQIAGLGKGFRGYWGSKTVDGWAVSGWG